MNENQSRRAKMLPCFEALHFSSFSRPASRPRLATGRRHSRWRHWTERNSTAPGFSGKSRWLNFSPHGVFRVGKTWTTCGRHERNWKIAFASSWLPWMNPSRFANSSKCIPVSSRWLGRSIPTARPPGAGEKIACPRPSSWTRMPSSVTSTADMARVSGDARRAGYALWWIVRFLAGMGVTAEMDPISLQTPTTTRVDLATRRC